ncbi:TPA: CD1845 family protein [Streptococcus agalactiae]
MRWIIKTILFPISLALSILTAFLTFLLGIGTAILYLLMMFCIFGAIASFLQKEVTIGIEALIIGFLVSPYGIPMVGAAVIAFLQGINKAIKSI